VFAFGRFSILVGKPLNHTGRKLNEFCRILVNGPNDLPGASYGLESGIIFNRQPGTHFRSRFLNTVVWQDRVFVDFVF
jgi:hypothetical protein